jgi:cysteine synthase A
VDAGAERDGVAVAISQDSGFKYSSFFADILGADGNPPYSVKCRIGSAMIWDAEQRDLLKPGVELIEPTSGNTGIALAFVAASRGYGLTLTLPETMSLERHQVLKAIGANLVLTDGASGMKSAIAEAEEIYSSDPKRYLLLEQFKNPANPAIHFRTNGPEIWSDTAGEIDILVSGVGTSGTISGVSRYIKHTRGKKILSVAVEPETSPVITQHLKGEPLKPGPHKIQGIVTGNYPAPGSHRFPGLATCRARSGISYPSPATCVYHESRLPQAAHGYD